MSAKLKVGDCVEFTKKGYTDAVQMWPWLEDPKKWETHLASKYEIVQDVRPAFSKRVLFLKVPQRDEPIAVFSMAVKKDCRKWRARRRMSAVERKQARAALTAKTEGAL